MPVDPSEIPKPPVGLKARGKTLWRDLHEQFDFSEDPHRSALVEEACRTADLIRRLQIVVDRAIDLRVTGSQQQPVAMPELSELRQYRGLLASLLKSLALPDSEELAQVKADHLTEVRRGAARARLTAVK